MKNKLIATLTKKQLRGIVGQLVTIDTNKLNKMSTDKLKPYLNNISYNQLTKLLTT